MPEQSGITSTCVIAVATEGSARRCRRLSSAEIASEQPCGCETTQHGVIVVALPLKEIITYNNMPHMIFYAVKIG